MKKLFVLKILAMSLIICMLLSFASCSNDKSESDKMVKKLEALVKEDEDFSCAVYVDNGHSWEWFFDKGSNKKVDIKEMYRLGYDWSNYVGCVVEFETEEDAQTVTRDDFVERLFTGDYSKFDSWLFEQKGNTVFFGLPEFMDKIK